MIEEAKYSVSEGAWGKDSMEHVSGGLGVRVEEETPKF